MAFIGLRRPPEQKVAAPLACGDIAPRSPDFPSEQPLLVVFLRHTGCPFAEAMAKRACSVSDEIPLVLVTHGDEQRAQRWLQHIGLTCGFTHVHDPQREIYGAWGLGYAGWGSLLHPMMFVRLLRLLTVGIHNRSASGTRWQRQAVFLVDGLGRIRWLHVAAHAGDLPTLPAVPFSR